MMEHVEIDLKGHEDEELPGIRVGAKVYWKGKYWIIRLIDITPTRIELGLETE